MVFPSVNLCHERIVETRAFDKKKFFSIAMVIFMLLWCGDC